MMSAWWLILIVPASALAGAVLFWLWFWFSWKD